VVGTLAGIWRTVIHGVQFDLTSGAGTSNTTPWSIEADIGVASPVDVGVTVTNINGNLQIADETSVAIDPNHSAVLAISTANLGWAQTLGTLNWTTTDQSSNQIPPDEPDPLSGDAAYAGIIAAGPYDPSNPSSYYRTWAGVTINVPNPPDQVERSVSGGAQNTFVPITQGIDLRGLAQSPVLAVDPNQIFINGLPETEIAYAVTSVYESTFGGNTWLQISQPLVTGVGNDFISALAISPSNSNVFYVGTASGKVFVDLHNGGDGFPNRSANLPGLGITGVAVDPANDLEAFATIGGFSTGAGHVFMTINGGAAWANITSNLPDVPSYAVAYDPRITAAFPNGRLYVGTQVGVYISLDLGKSWNKLGQGLPNVPVVDITFDQNFEKLAVATQGRGTWVINTDLHGPAAVAVSPSTPVVPTLSSIKVFFNKPVDPRTFTIASIDSFVGPNGPIAVTGVLNLDPGSFEQYRLSFAPQAEDGPFTLNIGPNIRDFVGNEMDQNNNGINGETADEFSTQFAISTSDDGHFVTGLYHDLLGRPADSSGFNNLIAPLDTTRAGELGPIAFNFLLSNEALSDLIYDPNITAQNPVASGYYEQFLHRAASGTEIKNWVNAVRGGTTPEQVIEAIVSSSEYFSADSGGTDTGFLSQLYPDLLGRLVDAGGLQTYLGTLTGAEGAARSAIVDALDQSGEYRTNLIQSNYTRLLKRSASTLEVKNWLGLFNTGITVRSSWQQSLAATNSSATQAATTRAGWTPPITRS
jgi:hypothetical protein